MPHSSRKKHPNNSAQAQKRLQITDATGWTHVTTGGKARRCVRTTTNTTNQHSQSPQEESIFFHPAEAPPTATLESLQSQFTQIQRTWKDSSACDVVGKTLRNILPHTTDTNTNSPIEINNNNDNKKNNDDNGIDSIICIGLGSPSGFLRGGWVDRRLVSLYQLAALVDVMASISSSFSSCKYWPSSSSSSSYDLSNSLQLNHPLQFNSSNNKNLRSRPRLQHSRHIPPL